MFHSITRMPLRLPSRYVVLFLSCLKILFIFIVWGVFESGISVVWAGNISCLSREYQLFESGISVVWVGNISCLSREYQFWSTDYALPFVSKKVRSVFVHDQQVCYLLLVHSYCWFAEEWVVPELKSAHNACVSTRQLRKTFFRVAEDC